MALRDVRLYFCCFNWHATRWFVVIATKSMMDTMKIPLSVGVFCSLYAFILALHLQGEKQVFLATNYQCVSDTFRPPLGSRRSKFREHPASACCFGIYLSFQHLIFVFGRALANRKNKISGLRVLFLEIYSPPLCQTLYIVVRCALCLFAWLDLKPSGLCAPVAKNWYKEPGTVSWLPYDTHISLCGSIGKFWGW